jgi:hypothetical protein
LFDEHAKQLIEDNINMAVPYYLMASYAYYVQDDPIFTDGFYDSLAKQILDNWDNITHRHRDVLNQDNLAAGSFLGEYPSIVEGALSSLRSQPNEPAQPKLRQKRPAPTDTMGAFGNPQDMFDWGKQ